MSERRREERAVYIISVAAELAGVHPQTLRIYERKGLLRPARTSGNTRRYSERDIARLRLIQDLTQKHGINLAGVKMIMGLQEDVVGLRRQLEALHEEVARVREVLERDTEPRADLVPLRSIRIFPWLKDSG
jgi:MerR family transcriptional regulator, heat shock protein HspR